MTFNMQTFSESVKEELSRYEYDENAMKAVLSSFLSNILQMSITSDGEVWELKSQFLPTIKLVNKFFKELYEVDTSVSFTEIQKVNNRRIYKLTIKGNYSQMSSDLQLNVNYPNMIVKNVIQQRAYLVGAFLSGGSVSSVNKSIYHLEIRSNKIVYLRLLQKLLMVFKISVSLLKRTSHFVLYIKKATDVSDFLKIIGANDSMQELEDRIIARDYYTNIHRLNNLDIANLRKTTKAGNEQIQMIRGIVNTNLYKAQPDKFKFYCSIRLLHPEASLSEMVRIFKEKYQISMTRTGINHYVLKIKDIYKINKLT